mgnify:CR=1 FL=1|jgi:hypothetical protein
MKKINYILVILLLVSCGSLNYVKEENLKEVKMPFKENNYEDNEEEFFTIQNATGNNLNIIRNRVLLAAKTDLSGKIKTMINSIGNQNLSFDNGNERETFDQKSTAISKQSIDKIIKVDSKTFKKENDNSYDYWVVYKVKLEDVIPLINSENIGFELNKKMISDNFQSNQN